MKNWFKFPQVRLFVLVSLVAFIYRDSFTSRFFQDDRILMRLAQTTGVFTAIPHFPYRPIAIQVFYSLGNFLFGNNPVGYHLLLFFAFAGSLFFLFRIMKILFREENKALSAVFFYALNISLFAEFYWIATSYFSLGALFFFGAIYFFLLQGFVFVVLCLLMFLLALGSNEMAFVLPAIFSLCSWYLREGNRQKLAGFWLLDGLLLFFRVIFIGFPKVADYTLKFNFQVLGTLRWYLLRVFDLPEGIRNNPDSPVIYLLLAVFLILMAVNLYTYFRKRYDPRLFLLGLLWFLTAGLPFYFLPGHMSSYYLALALPGITMIYATAVGKSYKSYIILAVYLLLTIFGLDFLRQTHWIILKNTGPIGQF